MICAVITRIGFNLVICIFSKVQRLIVLDLINCWHRVQNDRNAYLTSGLRIKSAMTSDGVVMDGRFCKCVFEH